MVMDSVMDMDLDSVMDMHMQEDMQVNVPQLLHMEVQHGQKLFLQVSQSPHGYIT